MVRRSENFKELYPLIGFFGIDVAVIVFLLYLGHHLTPALEIGAPPSVWFGWVLRLPRELQYPLGGFVLCIFPPVIAGVSLFLLSWIWVEISYGRTIASFAVLFFPVLGVYMFILPWEMTPIFMFLLLSGVMLAMSYFALHELPMLPLDTTSPRRREWTLEYLKHSHDDWKTLLNLSLGGAYSLLISLLIGAVTFFYSEVLRFGLTDPRGLFPYWQTVMVVFLSGLIILQIGYGVAYKFYQRMSQCTNKIHEVSRRI